jgi:hypothetical protein
MLSQNRESTPDLSGYCNPALNYLSFEERRSVKRRKALKSLGLGLSAGFVLPQFLTSCKKTDNGPAVNFNGTVAVIGAGAAGLYAADILRSKGINVILLEAGSELGGRIKSLRNQGNIPSQSIADFPVELGAEVTFGSDSIWGKVIQNLNISTVDLTNVPSQFILQNSAKTAIDWGGDSDYSSVQNFISGLPNFSGSGISVQDAAGVTARARPLLNSQVGNFYGSDSTLVGAQGLAEGLKLRKHDSKWLSMKANPFQDLLLSRFSLVTPKVLLNTPVTSIEYGGVKINITDKNGGVTTADKVIVTVPLSILKKGSISFSPPLPSTMTGSFSNLGMDASVRVVLDFKKNFWGQGLGFIWGGITGPQYFNAGAGRSQFERTLSVTINGPKAAELSVMGTNMVNPILAELDAIYGGQASLYIRRDENTNQILSTIQDWSIEQFIQGGFSYPLINGSISDRKNIGAPIGKTLFFAGEATDVNGDAGTINGALNSAERVAEEVVKSIIGP